MMATILSARYVAPGPWAGAIIAALGGLVRKERTMASATPATLESLRDREVIFELLRLETELIQDIQALKDRMTGDFGHALGVVMDRLDPDATDAYFENRKEDRDAC